MPDFTQRNNQYTIEKQDTICRYSAIQRVVRDPDYWDGCIHKTSAIAEIVDFRDNVLDLIEYTAQ